MNKSLLHSYMVRHKDTQATLATYLGIAVSTLNAKINEKGAEFRQGEIALIRERYGLSAEEIGQIFFTSNES